MPDEFKVWNANPAAQEVEVTPALRHDIALEVSDQVGVGDRPPWEERRLMRAWDLHDAGLVIGSSDCAGVLPASALFRP